MCTSSHLKKLNKNNFRQGKNKFIDTIDINFGYKVLFKT